MLKERNWLFKLLSYLNIILRMLVKTMKAALLEWESYSKMESVVTTESWVKNWEMLLIFCFKGWINGFHSEVKTDDEIVEVQSEA